jgi:type III secretory pathway component EscT
MITIDIFAPPILYPFLRVFGFLLLLPLNQGRALTRRTMIAALFTLPLLNFSLDTTTPLTTSLFGISLNVLIGLLYGLPAALIVRAAFGFGELTDVLRGQQIGQIYDPLTAQQQALFGGVFAQYLWVVLLLGGVMEIGLSGLAQSLQSFPLARTLNTDQLLHFLNVSFTLILSELSRIMLGMLQAILPLAVLCVIAEIAVGYIGRVLPGLQSTLLGLPIKSTFVALFVIGIVRTDWSAALITEVALTLPRVAAVLAVVR